MICEPGCGVKRLNRCLGFSNLVCNEWMVIVFDRLPVVWCWFSLPSSSCTPSTVPVFDRLPLVWCWFSSPSWWCTPFIVPVFDRLPMVWCWFSPPSSSCTPSTVPGSHLRPTPVLPLCSLHAEVMAVASSLTISESLTTGCDTTHQRYELKRQGV